MAYGEENRPEDAPEKPELTEAEIAEKREKIWEKALKQVENGEEVSLGGLGGDKGGKRGFRDEFRKKRFEKGLRNQAETNAEETLTS